MVANETGLAAFLIPPRLCDPGIDDRGYAATLIPPHSGDPELARSAPLIRDGEAQKKCRGSIQNRIKMLFFCLKKNQFQKLNEKILLGFYSFFFLLLSFKTNKKDQDMVKLSETIVYPQFPN